MKPLAPHYSQDLSALFWKRVNALKQYDHATWAMLYSEGCRLQRLESETLKELAKAHLDIEDPSQQEMDVEALGICRPTDHDFEPLGTCCYYKWTPSAATAALSYDRTVGYRQLYCRKCGETREIIERHNERD